MEPWEGVVSIPEGRSGSFEIRHFTQPAGALIRTTFRTVVMGGHTHGPVEFDHATRWHELLEEGCRWMSDLPIEQQQHDNMLEPMSGHVLVGGLGLGYAATTLAMREEVTKVTVVEISPDVIKLVEPHLKNKKIHVVKADLFDYLRKLPAKKKFDWAFYDIWRSDGEGTFFKTVCPLRKLSWTHVADQRIFCWNEDVMRGQLFFSLIASLHDMRPGSTVADRATQKNDMWWDWSVPFFKAIQQGKISPTVTQLAAHAYSLVYGLPSWQRCWLSGINATRARRPS